MLFFKKYSRFGVYFFILKKDSHLGIFFGGQLGTGLVALFGLPKRATNPVPTGNPPSTPSPFYNYLGENRYE